MPASSLLRRLYFYAAYHLYAKYKLTKTDECRLLGFRINVPPTVFHPSLFFTSKMLGEYVLSLNLLQKRVLDVGCGTGILSLAAASKGACVMSLDINEDAVVASKRNIAMNLPRNDIEVIHSDLFDSIPVKKKFDWILWNPPFYPQEPTDIASYAWNAGTDFRVIDRFASTAANHLASNGRILLILTSDIDIRKVLEIFHSRGFSSVSRIKRRVLFETLEIYELAQ